jgi:hypothetical protein
MPMLLIFVASASANANAAHRPRVFIIGRVNATRAERRRVPDAERRG